MKKNNYIQQLSSKYLILVAIALFLTPSFPLPIPGLPALRLEEVISLIYIAHIFYLEKQKNSYIIFPRKIILFYLIILLLTISIINSYIHGYSTSLREIIEYVMWGKFIIIYIMVVNANVNKFKIINAIKYSSIILFLLVTTQYFNILGLNDYYIDFVAPTQAETLLNNYVNPRAVGMVGNPNALAFIFVLMGIVSFYINLSHRITLLNLAWFICSTFGIILTQSRTAFIAYLIGIVLLMLMSIVSTKTSFKSLFRKIILIFSVPAISYLIFQNDYIQTNFLWRFNTIADFGQEASWQQRMINWSENIELIKNHFLLGVGPLRGASLIYPADNEWLLLLRMHGLVGTVCIILFFLSFYFKKGISNYLILIILIVTSIYMITAAVINSLILMPILIIILHLFSHTDLRSFENENLPYNKFT